MEDKTILKNYISKRKKASTIKPVEVKEVKLAWYQKPIMREDFVTKIGRDKKLYVHHKEWKENIFIGPYNNTHEITDVISSYVMMSLKTTLDKAPVDNIHSIVIDNVKEFFKNENN